MTSPHQTTKQAFLARLGEFATGFDWSDGYAYNVATGCRAVLDDRDDDDIVVYTKEQVERDVQAFSERNATRWKESTLHQYATMYVSACRTMRGEGRIGKSSAKFRLAVNDDSITVNTAAKTVTYKHQIDGAQMRRIETEVEALIAKILDEVEVVG